MFHVVALLCSVTFGGCLVAIPKEKPFSSQEKCETYLTNWMLRVKMSPAFKDALINDPKHLFVGQCVDKPADWNGNEHTQEIMTMFKPQLDKHFKSK